MARKQMEFEGLSRPGEAFGGGLLKGNPKTSRPLASKFPIHLTLRANKSMLRLPKTYDAVQEITYGVAKKHGVLIYKNANVGNHLHLAIKLRHVRHWAAFIRELTGRIALKIKQLTGFKGLWKFRPHTRVIKGWRRPFHVVIEYIGLNQAEADGFISRKDIRNLRDLKALFDSA